MDGAVDVESVDVGCSVDGRAGDIWIRLPPTSS